MNINGILVIDKPKGRSSHDMVYFTRRLTGVKRVGHTGTLDPDATGVLPVMIGKATKLSDLLLCDDKVYEVRLVYGKSTDTQDSSGTVIFESDINPAEEEIENVINEFIGDIEQIPPMYSAIKKNGQKLYDLARKGITIEREPREIKIHSIDIVDINTENKYVIMEVFCSKGTYIRTLCDDIGKKLGTGAYMSELRRTKSGMFDISYAYTTEEIENIVKAGCLEDYIMPIEQIFPDMGKVKLNELLTSKYKNGIKIRREGLLTGQKYLVYGFDSELLGISEYNGNELVMKISLWS